MNMETSRLTRVSLAVAITMLIVHVASAHVRTVFDKSTNFTLYTTFMWITEPKTHDPLLRRRIVDDVNTAMAAGGLILTASDADLAIAAHAATYEHRTLNSFYHGVGGGWLWDGDFGSAAAVADTYEAGTLVIDIFDSRTKAAIWRGASSKTLSDDRRQNADSVNKAVVEMFRNFPTRSQKSKWWPALR